VLADLLGDEAGVDLLGHAVTSADAGDCVDTDPARMDSAAERTARTMFW